MIRQPAPRIVADPGIAKAVVPEPLAVAKGRPAGRRLRFPDGAEIGGIDPDTGSVQVGEAVAQPRRMRRGGGREQHFVALVRPAVRLERRDLAIEKEAGRMTRVQLDHLACVQIELRAG